jgi:hypothetical protein
MPMPQPGYLITAFSVQPGHCFRMVYDYKLQATHCRQPAAWKGVWRDATGRSWYVEACREHAPKWQGRKSQPAPDRPFDPVRNPN